MSTSDDLGRILDRLDAIEAQLVLVMRNLPLQDDTRGSLNAQARDLLNSKGAIVAIKFVREQTGWGLRRPRISLMA